MLQAFGGGTLFGERYGTGMPWVLALPGWQRTHEDFAGVFSAPAGDELAAVALDLPGFGAAPPPEGPWSTAEYAEFIEPVLAEMNERVVVLGHSFGAIVACQLARRAPQRVAALVLTGAPLFRPRSSTRRVAPAYRALRVARRMRLVSDSSLERARERYGSLDYRLATPVMRAVLVQRLSEDYEPLLKELLLPVELVWGAEDTAAPVEVAERAAAVLGDAHVEVLSGVDHFTPTRAPQALRDALFKVRP